MSGDNAMVNISVKKACSIAENQGWTITSFDSISAHLEMKIKKEEDRKRKSFILRERLKKLDGIGIEEMEYFQNYVFVITANGY